MGGTNFWSVQYALSKSWYANATGQDHRLIDGADGAHFTNEIVHAMEDVHATFLGL